MKKIDELMPVALEVAACMLAEDGKIHKEYNGYISAFGVLARSGLKPAIASFENKSADSKQDKTKLMKALLKIVCLYREKELPQPPNDTLMAYVLSCAVTSIVKHDILVAATALKLAIRTFELVPGGGE